jgi:hypothetical protein
MAHMVRDRRVGRGPRVARGGFAYASREKLEPLLEFPTTVNRQVRVGRVVRREVSDPLAFGLALPPLIRPAQIWPESVIASISRR